MKKQFFFFPSNGNSSQMKVVPYYVYMLNKCILPESRVLQQQKVSENGYQMHEILPARFLPSMFLEGHEPQSSILADFFH